MTLALAVLPLVLVAGAPSAETAGDRAPDAAARPGADAGIGVVLSEVRGRQDGDPVLDSVGGRMPETLDGRPRRSLGGATLGGLPSLEATFRGEEGPMPDVEVTVVRGLPAQRYVHESLVGGLRGEGRVSETTVAGVPVFEGTVEGRAFLAAFPDRFAVILSGEPAEGSSTPPFPSFRRGLVQILDEALAPFLGAGEEARGAAEEDGGGSVRSTVVWDDLAFSLHRPGAWRVGDLGPGPGGGRALVLVRDPEVAPEGLGGIAGISGRPLALGSRGNVGLVVAGASAGPGGKAGTAPAVEGLRRLLRSGFPSEILAEGQPTGSVTVRRVGQDSLPSFPYRGLDRDGRQVTGRVYGIPAAGRLLLGHVLAGPDAPASAVDTAERALGSVEARATGGGAGRDGR